MLIPELKENRHMITYYRVGDKKTAAGVLLALLDHKKNKIVFGWSKIGIDKTGKFKDNFSKERGQFIAMKRALNGGLKNVPVEMKPLIDRFMADVKHFFRSPEVHDTITFKEDKPKVVSPAIQAA